MIAHSSPYADPTVCPACRAALPHQPESCPSCDLPLQVPLAVELFSTLTRADDILTRLRASTVRPTPPAPTRNPPTVPTASLPPLPAAAPRHGLRGSSVASILLGLGALCLLVAAVIFLAVAWSWLGVGGRTAVLVALTAISAVAGTVLAGRGLRIAGEALTAVAFGLLMVDIAGAVDAGWLDGLEAQGLARLSGIVLLVPALALSASRDRLAVPQLVAPAALATILASLDWSSYAWREFDTVGPATMLAFFVLAAWGRAIEARMLAGLAAGLAAVSWAGFTLLAMGSLVDDTTAHGLWLEGSGWEITAMALLTLTAWGVGWDDDGVRQGAASVAVCLVTGALVLPFLAGSPDQVAVTVLVVVVLCALVAAATPPRWYAVPRAPLALAGLPAVGIIALMAAQSGVAVAFLGDPFTRSASLRLPGTDEPFHPLVLPMLVAGLVVAAYAATARRPWFGLATLGATGLTGLLTLCLFPVPAWLVLTLGAVAVAGLGAMAMRREGPTGTWLAIAATGLTLPLLVLSLPSAVLSFAASVAVTAASAVTLSRGRFPGAWLAAAVLPAATASLIWCATEVAAVDTALRAAPVLLALGVIAIRLPRPEVELVAAPLGALASAVAIEAAVDGSVSLALHLTIAGALVTASALANTDRRVLAWPGGGLLACATWVRLWDVGVQAPEAYTLPSAIALLLVGLHRLRTSASTSTVETLVPGLALATVPSLVWVLDDPLSPRAVLLGLVCLGLVLGGTALRWNAPVVVGAVVGSLIVLRELAPYVAQTPQWVLIGAAGATLLGVGITWESRMNDLDRASAYLGRLR